MTLSEIKDQYAKEKGHKDWKDFTSNFGYCNIGFIREEALDEIALRYFEANKGEYATACCKATQEKIADKFKSWPAKLFWKSESDNEIISSNSIVIL